MSDRELDICEELWDDSVELKLVEESEGQSEVDGVHILAKVRGPAFFPEVVSGNKVLYPREAWEKAISESTFQRKLNDRLIYGTIGHGIRLDDDAIRNGKFSHIVTNIGIDESGVGHAEYLVLNTPSGRILNTILRAKSRIRVSTKARGLFKDTTKSGIKVINPDAFKLERIDFVIDPGYLQAHPDLIESLDLSNKEEEPINMIDVPVEESLTLLEEYRKLGSPSEISESLTTAGERIDQLVNLLESHEQSIVESIQMDHIEEELKRYRKLGSPLELERVVESADKMVNYIYAEKVKGLAKKHNISEALINKMVDKGVDLSIVEELLDGQSGDNEVKLDADGNPIKDGAESAEESRRTPGKKYRLVSEEDGSEYQVDDDGNPVLDADGNPVRKEEGGGEMGESRRRIPSKKFKLVNEEDGTEYMTDDEGNPIKDDDGNPVPKEKPAEESRRTPSKRLKLVNEEDGSEYEVDDDGNPILDDDGNPVAKKKEEQPASESRRRPFSHGRPFKAIREEDTSGDEDETPPEDKPEDTSESRRHQGPSTRRFSKVEESKTPTEKPAGQYNFRNSNPILSRLRGGQ